MRRLLLAFTLLIYSNAVAQTPNMGITEPTVGVTVGPTWAQMINAAFDTIDAHDHTAGKGARITPSALNINADLSFVGHQATNLKTSAYQSQGGTLASSFTGTVYNVGGNLYWNNGSGAAVQITNGTAVNNSVSGAVAAATPGAYPYTVSAADAQKVLLVDTASARTINLPAATTAVFFAIKDTAGTGGTNAITLVRAGSDTIDGVGGNRTLKTNFGWWWVVSNGTNGWNVAEAMPGAIPSNGQIPVGNGAGYTVANLTGTSNQVTVTNGAGTVTLSTPQNIHTGASPTFAGVNLSGLTASLPVFTDGSKNLATQSVSAARTALGVGTGDKPSFAGVTLTAGSTFTATNFGLTADTSDGSDSKAIALLGGGLPGGASQARGGYLYAAGNEHATAPGVAQIFGGDISGGRVDIFAPASNGVVNLGAGSTSNDWQLESDGDLAQDATNGGDIIFARSGKGVVHTVDASLAGNGGGLTKSISVITSGSSGRVLPAASGWVGKKLVVVNTSASSNDISCAGADTIVNAPPFFTLTSNAAATVVGIDSSHWALIENP